MHFQSRIRNRGRNFVVWLVAGVLLVSSGVTAVSAQQAYDVRLEVGDDFQAVVDANPPGSRYLIASGVHRQQQVVPHDGDTFIGEPEAVLSGARVLSPKAFIEEGGQWWAGGQAQAGLVHGQEATEPGRERDAHPEEVFVNGGMRLRHVASRAQLGSGRWYFDYDADRVWLGDDPKSFKQIEISIQPFAFGGTAVRDVTLENIVVEMYASPFQFGAIGGDQNNRYTYDWTLRDITARYNHGAGILLGPGGTLERSYVHHNGQLGIGGNGIHPESGYTAPVVVRDSEIAHNRQLGVNWGWEGGGTKFSMMSEMEFTNNWVHHNKGPGVWFDVRNRGSVVSSNLVEDNENQGIFYEISSGGRIFWNTVRRNSTAVSGGGAGAAIDISNSSDTEVAENLVSDSPNSILFRYDHNRREQGVTENNWAHGNDVQIAIGLTALIVDNGPSDYSEWFEKRNNVFSENLFRVPDLNDQLFSWGNNYEYPRLDAAGWTAVHPRDSVIADTRPGSLPSNAVGFRGPVGPGSAPRDSVLPAEPGTGSTPPSTSDRSTRTGDPTVSEISVGNGGGEAPDTADAAVKPFGSPTVEVREPAVAVTPEGQDPPVCDASIDPSSVSGTSITRGLTRLEGADRIGTAATASQAICGDAQAPAVVLARSDLFPDAQVGSPLAVQLGAPLLLTGGNELHPTTESEIQRILPPGRMVHLLGGTAALSHDIEQRLIDLGYGTIRYGGVNRFQTAAMIVQHGLQDPMTLLVADGSSFVEPVLAGAAAANHRGPSGGEVGAGILLSSGANPAPETMAYLSLRGDAPAIIAIGGAAATAHQDAEVVSGASPSETSVKVAERFFDRPSAIAVARSDDFPDALAGAAVIGRSEIGPGPVLLTQPSALAPVVADWIQDNADSLERTVLFGGEVAISGEVEASVEHALGF